MTGAAPDAGYDAVVLAGGAASRLGGRDKPAERVGGRTLLDGVLAAAADARVRVVVGPVRPTAAAVRWTREDPPGGGPLAALAAALPLTAAPVVVLLAADLPFLDPPAVRALLAALAGPGGDGVLAEDGDGRIQWLLSAWRRPALVGALAGIDPAGRSLRGTLGRLDTAAVRLPAGPRPAWFDCDTPGQVDWARQQLTERTPDEPAG